MRAFLLAAATASLTLAAASDAHSQQQLTAASCVAYLTTDPQGPRLSPTNLRIGTTGTVDGMPFTVFGGMLVEDVCAAALERRAQLLRKDQRIANLESEVARITAAGAADAAFRKNAERSLIRSYPYETLLIAIAITSFLTLLAMLFWRVLVRLFDRLTGNRRRMRSSGTFMSSRRSSYHL
ncbi:MAG: hypothetical protein V4644_02850 [Patescibacteria group bacterium]